MIKKVAITVKCNPVWTKYKRQRLHDINTKQMLLQFSEIEYWIGGDCA